MSGEVLRADASPIYLCSEPTDMRLGFQGLAKKVRADLSVNPETRGLYVFVSRDFRRIKLLYWDQNGFAMWYKFVNSRIFRIEHVGGYKKLTGVNLKELIGRDAPPAKKRLKES